jgi:hypothetical protein
MRKEVISMRYAVCMNRDIVSEHEVKRKRKLTPEMEKRATISKEYDFQVGTDKDGNYTLTAVKKSVRPNKK